MGNILLWLVLGAAVCALDVWIVLALINRWGRDWGATAKEIASAMAGDAYLHEDGARRVRVEMTRAIDVDAPPDVVWSYLCQLGRGAGFYSLERLDNGGKTSAGHLVSWIPAPRLGDASAIGYLRYVDPGRELAWWLPGETQLRTEFRMAPMFRVTPRDDGSRLVIRISGDALGATAPVVRFLFTAIDSVMAVPQLKGIRRAAEAAAAGRAPDGADETGARDQYQLYHVIFADGAEAGVAGKEKAPQWHAAAVEQLGERFGEPAGPTA